ncbi:molybdate ABC transporter substrate-binding protein [Sinanaerobacter chloroacetimidivorans]|nr:molybdate ABC transporter substrate-binding protein [Sinanaerobacter chloroacetimidivorans]
MMKKISLVLVILMIFALAFTGCAGKPEKPPAAEGPTDESVEINISAAASLTDALTEIQAEYAKESNAVLQFNFAASGTLQKQIQEGAPCDLFISASKAHMDALQDAGLIVADSRRDLLGNALTLIAAAEKADAVTPEALTGGDVTSISIGTPESVPAGKYAQEALENMGIWDQIQDKLILAKDVRQVLEYVDTGNVDCGLVYKSDALLLKTGVVIGDLPEDSHSPIIYPSALIVNSAQAEAAAKFYEFLQTDYAKGVFENYGFTVL